MRDLTVEMVFEAVKKLLRDEERGARDEGRAG
jgi:hypothetical protein